MNLDTVFYNGIKEQNTSAVMSTNPYDYIRAGYYLDNAVLFGGRNNVNYKCDFKRYSSGNRLADAD